VLSGCASISIDTFVLIPLWIPLSLQLSSKNRTYGCFRTLSLLGLAFCVFTWGFQYKLSLYDPPQTAPHQVPMAKLLSRNEQSDRLEDSIFTQSNPPTKVLRWASTAALLILLIACLISPPDSSQWRPVEHRSMQLRQSLLEAHFVRPPPSFI
jgi:hypothetical protein